MSNRHLYMVKKYWAPMWWVQIDVKEKKRKLPSCSWWKARAASQRRTACTFRIGFLGSCSRCRNDRASHADGTTWWWKSVRGYNPEEISAAVGYTCREFAAASLTRSKAFSQHITRSDTPSCIFYNFTRMYVWILLRYD